MLKRILLIDRDTLRRGELSEALSKEGFDVIDFESGKEAVKLLRLGSVKAVVLDYGSSYESQSPVLSGKRIVQEITHVNAFVPLILICDRCVRLEHETSAAADLVIRRPMTGRQLIDAIKSVSGETLRERVQRKSGYIFAFR